jgi:hypothetical protein
VRRESPATSLRPSQGPQLARQPRCVKERLPYLSIVSFEHAPERVPPRTWRACSPESPHDWLCSRFKKRMAATIWAAFRHRKAPTCRKRRRLGSSREDMHGCPLLHGDQVKTIARFGFSRTVVGWARKVSRQAKTIHILRYIHEEPLRQAIQLQLNRGEFRHILAKPLSFANQGDLPFHPLRGSHEQGPLPQRRARLEYRADDPHRWVAARRSHCYLAFDIGAPLRLPAVKTILAERSLGRRCAPAAHTRDQSAHSLPASPAIRRHAAHL